MIFNVIMQRILCHFKSSQLYAKMVSIDRTSAFQPFTVPMIRIASPLPIIVNKWYMCAIEWSLDYLFMTSCPEQSFQSSRLCTTYAQLFNAHRQQKLLKHCVIVTILLQDLTYKHPITASHFHLTYQLCPKSASHLGTYCASLWISYPYPKQCTPISCHSVQVQNLLQGWRVWRWDLSRTPGGYCFGYSAPASAGNIWTLSKSEYSQCILHK